ncbi:hypothetical protein Asulf_01442 [Archaeoglobus sulfaticallidus PM70-1]|uniref:Amidohydrolase-related domain-containing protein n=1 Tax=Archaeoglobus sulfaticallidus PM70-1 TaxID=387631 RepID=N0BCU1_9EURY|nr:amidohydrolase family protein [Archaeoglobus sulfaticallidus]AGK61429.1 hypothetical protein Asulf_01442 [Archaeoglobus sulfaticallidus PM70-1]
MKHSMRCCLIEFEDDSSEFIIRTGVLDGKFFEERDVDWDVDFDFVIIPSFYNSHIHLGDSIAMDPPPMELEELVGPGGYKFRILEAEKSRVPSAIKDSIEYAVRYGTTSMTEFREGDLEGLSLIRDGFEVLAIFGRPSTLESAEKMLEGVRGFGMSSVRDHDYAFLEDLRDLARKKDRMFGIHAGEKDSLDVEKAIALQPDFIVHMNMADKKSIEECMDAGIPIISCMRSNFFFGLENRKNYRIFEEYDRWCIGTDNVMIANPSVLSELNFAGYIVSPENALKAAYRGFEVFGMKPKWVVLDIREMKNSRNLIASIVRRANHSNIVRVVDEILIE